MAAEGEFGGEQAGVDGEGLVEEAELADLFVGGDVDEALCYESAVEGNDLWVSAVSANDVSVAGASGGFSVIDMGLSGESLLWFAQRSHTQSYPDIDSWSFDPHLSMAAKNAKRHHSGSTRHYLVPVIFVPLCVFRRYRPSSGARVFPGRFNRHNAKP